MSEAEMCLRLLAAFGFGAVIGFEREYLAKPAGLRTHTVVCVAAALLMTSSILIADELDAGGEALRVAAGAITGIGFIGAGTILQTRRTVIGLTTAGTIFMAAAIGLTVGAGLYYLALTAAGLTVLATWGLRPLDAVLGQPDDEAELEEEPARPKVGRPASPRKLD